MVPAVTLAVTVVVMILLAALAGLAQVAVEVISTFMASPLARVVLVYVALFAPGISTPFFCHW
jgi:hypothetical protein